MNEGVSLLHLSNYREAELLKKSNIRNGHNLLKSSYITKKDLISLSDCPNTSLLKMRQRFHIYLLSKMYVHILVLKHFSSEDDIYIFSQS